MTRQVQQHNVKQTNKQNHELQIHQQQQQQQQQDTILRAIYVSSSGTWPDGQLITSTERQQGYTILQEFSSSQYTGKIQLCLQWLQQTSLQFYSSSTNGQQQVVDCTIAAKLYACEIISDCLKKLHYSQWNENDRIQLRTSILIASKYQAIAPIINDSSQYNNLISNNNNSSTSVPLANKLSSLLAELMIRDFPQRWSTCISDLFTQLWSSSSTSTEGIPQIGNRMCLQILQLVAEDCTDSDFNSKVRRRRNNNNKV